MKTELSCRRAGIDSAPAHAQISPRQPAQLRKSRFVTGAPGTPHLTPRRILLIYRTLFLMAIIPHLFTHPAAGGQTVSLAWDPATNSATAGYAFYYGPSSSNYTTRIDAGTNTTLTLTGL